MAATTVPPRYVDVHKAPKGAGDARPTALQIIKDQELTDGLPDKVILITGCSSGLGVETAKVLATTGATLFLTARNLKKAKEALGNDLVNNSRVHLLELDLMSLDSVRQCAQTFLKQSSKLDILITNAGIRHTSYGLTKDGFEQQFGVCHLAHFLFFQLLKPTLLSSSTPGFHSRVVALTSSGHYGADNYPLNFNDLNFKNNPKSYTPPRGYAQAKLANIYMTNEINRRYAAQGLNANAVMPGGILTGLQQGNNGGALREILTDWRLLISMPSTMRSMKSVEQGSATTVWAATAKELEDKGGFYLEDCGVAGPARKGARGIDPGYGVNAFNEDAAKKLWEVSNELVNFQEE